MQEITRPRINDGRAFREIARLRETEYRRRCRPPAENTCKRGCSHRHNLASSDLWPGANMTKDETFSVNQKPLVYLFSLLFFTAIVLFVGERLLNNKLHTV